MATTGIAVFAALKIKNSMRNYEYGTRSAALTVLEQIIDAQTDVPGDLAQQGRREVAASVKRHRGRATIGVAKLLVRTALPHFVKTGHQQNGNDLARLENRDARHSGHDHGLRTDGFGFKLGLAIGEQHGDHVLQIGVQLIERLALAVRAGEAGHIAHIELRVGAAFNHGGVGMHGTILEERMRAF